jgi:hypothetical protein
MILLVFVLDLTSTYEIKHATFVVLFSSFVVWAMIFLKRTSKAWATKVKKRTAHGLGKIFANYTFEIHIYLCLSIYL